MSSRASRWWTAWVLGCVIACSAVAHAESPEAQVERMANEAVAAYKAANYNKAIELLEKAYAIRQVAALLYNTAKAYDKIGNAEKSLELYRRYVASDDADSKLRAKAETRIATLEPLVKPKPVEPPKPVVVEPPKPTGPPPPTALDSAKRVQKRDRIIALSLGIVGVAALASATGLVIHADGIRDDFSASRDEEQKRTLKSSAKTYALTGDVLFGVGAAAVAVAAYFTYRGFRPLKEAPRAMLVPWMNADGAGASLGGRF